MVAGLRDQFAGPNPNPSSRVDEMVTALLLASQGPTRRAQRRLEEVLGPDDCMQWIDQLGTRLGHTPEIATDRIRPLIKRIALRTQRRGALKYAIAILGFCGNPGDLDFFKTVGRHEEFTLYAAVAMANTQKDPMDGWFRLAKLVTGWGKIDLVTRICDARPQAPEIRDWLLRHGCENSIMNEYLGLVVAQGADLLGALRQADPDDDLIRGAGIILAALTEEAPSPGFSEYPDGPEAVRLFFTHLLGRPGALLSLVHTGQLRDYLGSPECTWADRKSLGMMAGLVISQPHWRLLVEQNLGSQDERLAWYAWRASRILKLDVAEDRINRLLIQPLDRMLWYTLVAGCTEQTMQAALTLTRQLLPLEEVFTGPEVSSEMIEPLNSPYACLGIVLQEVRRFPGLGGDLLTQSLRSRNEGNRATALSALDEWTGSTVTADMRMAVEHTASADPSDRIRGFARETLARWDGEPSEV